jgi:uncharacterized protein
MKVVLIGASTNPERYAYKAATSLVKHGHEVHLLGIKAGEVAGISIQTERPTLKDIDTVTLYVNPVNQKLWYDYILELQPRRIIFNPGTENEELMEQAETQGIEIIEGCTLVMLSVGTF